MDATLSQLLRYIVTGDQEIAALRRKIEQLESAVAKLQKENDGTKTKNEPQT